MRDSTTRFTAYMPQCGGLDSGNVVGRINEVTLRRAGLVLRWVTVLGNTVLVFNQATQANSAWSSLCG